MNQPDSEGDGNFDVEPTQELYEGWKVLRLDHDSAASVSFEAFLNDFKVCRDLLPTSFLLNVALWEISREHGLRVAQLWEEAEIKVATPKISEGVRLTLADDAVLLNPILRELKGDQDVDSQ